MDTPPPPSPPWILKHWQKLLWVGYGVLVTLYLLRRTEHQQEMVQRSIIAGTATAVLAPAWFFLLSGFSLRTKLHGLYALLASAGLFFLLFKMDGTSGNLLPRFVFRWTPRGELAQLPTTPSSEIAKPITPPGAQDFTQFLGNNRNAMLEPLAMDEDWTKNAPQRLWGFAIGEGFGGFAVSGGYAVTQEQREDKEMVVCYNLNDGKILWSHSLNVRYENELGGVGPRATPTIQGQHVLTMGATGWLCCLDLATGKQHWAKNVVEDLGAEVPDWGVAGSPLVFDDSVVVAPGNANGATLASFSLETGLRQWIIGTQIASYSSPILTSLLGERVILYLGASDLTAHDPASGKQLWFYPWKPELRQPHVAIPMVTAPNHIVISSGYGKGSMKIEVSKGVEGWRAEEVWKTNRMKAKFTNLIVFGDHIYGLDDRTFASLNHQTGTLAWREGNYLHGQILFIKPNRILVSAENGEIALVEPQPTALHEIARFRGLDSANKCWNPPTLAGEYLLLRNNREVACYRLPMLSK